MLSSVSLVVCPHPLRLQEFREALTATGARVRWAERPHFATFFAITA